jgi:hypothetical protein
MELTWRVSATTVPETAIHKDGDTGTWQNEVSRTPPRDLSLQAEPNSSSV